MSAVLSRRHLLQLAAAGALSGAVAPAGALAGASPDSPDGALSALLEGNRRFASGRAEEPHRKLARVRAVAAKQTPFAAVLGCADSRVPVELLFDQGFGDIFVVRVAGNIATPEGIASLEFGTQVLGARVLMVLGHGSCGAVKAAMANAPVPGQISALFQHIAPAIEGTADLDAAVASNARFQARTLTQASPVLAGLVRSGALRVVGATYDLDTGRVQTIAG